VQGEAFTVVVFAVGGQRHGLPASAVQELVRAVAVVPLPRAPAGVEGVINLRGQVVPVLSLRARLGLPDRPLEPSDHFIIARTGQQHVALRVDRALDLVSLDAAEVDPGIELVSAAGWVARLPDGLVLIHDLNNLLSPSESAALADVLPTELAQVEKGGPP